MNLKIRDIYIIGLIVVLLGFANYIFDANEIEIIEISRPAHAWSYVPTQEQMHEMQKKVAKIPFVSEDFVGFKEALAFKESQGKYSRVNTLGYMGKYQFGRSTLRSLHINPNKFLKDPILQEKVFLANVKRNKWHLRKEIKRFSGKRIKGIKITESGILAAAHLGGVGAVKKFLYSYGKKGSSDAYGATVAYYLRKFSDYDLSDITPSKNPSLE